MPTVGSTTLDAQGRPSDPINVAVRGAAAQLIVDDMVGQDGRWLRWPLTLPSVDQFIQLDGQRLKQVASLVRYFDYRNPLRFVKAEVKRYHLRVWDVPAVTEVLAENGRHAGFVAVGSAHTEFAFPVHRVIDFGGAAAAVVETLLPRGYHEDPALPMTNSETWDARVLVRDM
jgi:hypothetical protein